MTFEEFENLVARIAVSPTFLNDVGNILITSVTRNFEEGGRVSNTNSPSTVVGGNAQWKDLSPVTKFARSQTNRKGKAGTSDNAFNILVRSGRLRNSINYKITGGTLQVGTNVKYAAIHHFGGMAGKNKKVSIPSRPFLVVQDEDIEEITQLLKESFFSP